MKKSNSDFLLITGVILIACTAFIEGFSSAGKLVAALGIVFTLLYMFFVHREDNSVRDDESG